MVGKWHLGLKYRTADGGVARGWDDADLTQPLADCPLDHGFDFFFGISRSHNTSGPNGQIHPQELYDLAEDLGETHNRIDDPAAKPALDFLIQQAQQAAGDDAFTRPL
jgi:arylsulfatase A-like enzyme